MLLIIVKVMFTNLVQGKKTKQVLNFDRNSPRRNEKWLEIGKKLHEVLFIENLVENFELDPIKIFAEIVVRGNSMQIGPSFPAKSLRIYTKKFFFTSFD